MIHGVSSIHVPLVNGETGYRRAPCRGPVAIALFFKIFHFLVRFGPVWSGPEVRRRPGATMTCPVMPLVKPHPGIVKCCFENGCRAGNLMKI